MLRHHFKSLILYIYLCTFTTPLWAGEGYFSQMLGYWSEKIEEVYESTTDYWTPRLKKIKDRTLEYWEPRFSRAAKDAAIKFNRDIHPKIIKNYSKLNEKYGPTLARIYRETVTYWKPLLIELQKSTVSYWYNKHPEFFDYLTRVPPPLKKAMDYYVRFSLKLGSQKQDDMEVPEEFEGIFMLAMESTNTTTDPEVISRVDDLLEEIRPYVDDPGMQECYNVEVFQSLIRNAFNVGCTIFISTNLVNFLNDEELIGVLAHEISHGDQGHSAKNMWNLVSTAGNHMVDLIYEEFEWLTTGIIGPYLQAVIDQGNMPLILDAFGKIAPAQEIEADQGATLILFKAGIHPKAFKDALIKLHGLKPGDVIIEDNGTYNSGRDYPSLFNRLRAVDQTWEELSAAS